MGEGGEKEGRRGSGVFEIKHEVGWEVGSTNKQPNKKQKKDIHEQRGGGDGVVHAPPGPSLPPGTAMSLLAKPSSGSDSLRTTWLRPRSSS